MSAIEWENIQKAIQNWVVAGSGLAADHVIWMRQKIPQRATNPYIELSVETIIPPSHDWVTKELNPLVFSDKTIASVDTAADQLTITAHGLTTADGPVRFTSTASMPGGLEEDTDYWVVVDTVDKIRLASTYVHTGGNNVARGLGSSPNPITTIDITSAGSGTIKLVKTSTTVRAGSEIKRTANGWRTVTVRAQVFSGEGTGIQPMKIAHDVIASLPLHIDELDAAGVGMSGFDVVEIEGGIKATDRHDGGLLEPRAIVDLSVFVSSQVVGYLASVDRVQVTSTATLADGNTVAIGVQWIDAASLAAAATIIHRPSLGGHFGGHFGA